MPITLEGFLRYKPDLLDGLTLPAGLRQDILRSYIRRKCGILFPWQQQPEQLKEDIGFWAQSQYQNWLMWQAAYNAEYDIRSDSTERETYAETYGQTWSDRGSEDTTSHGEMDGTRSSTGSSKNDTEASTSSSTQVDSSGSDNSDKKQPGYNQVGNPISVEQNVANHSAEETATGSSTDTFTGTGSTNSSETRKDISSGTNNVDLEHSGKEDSTRNYTMERTKEYGGLEIMEQLQEAFRAREDLDVYEMIRAQFESEFLMQIY